MKSLSESLLSKKVSIDMGPEILRALLELHQNDWDDFILTTENSDTLIIDATPEARYNRSINLTTVESDLLHKNGIEIIKLRNKVHLTIYTHDLVQIKPFTIIDLDYSMVYLNSGHVPHKVLSGWNISASNITIMAARNLDLKNCTFQSTDGDRNELSIGNLLAVPKMEHVKIERFNEFSILAEDPVVRKYSDILRFKWPDGVTVLDPHMDGQPHTFTTPELQGLLGCTWDSKMKEMGIYGTDLCIQMTNEGSKWLVEIKADNNRALKIKPSRT